MTDNSSITQYLSNDKVRENIHEVLSDRAPQFITSVISLVSADQKLKDAEKKSVIGACMVAATLNLPVNSNLGYAYIIPYKNKEGIYVAQFQMGWKGYVQLAMRTNQYKTINVSEVRDGEMLGFNRLTGEIEFQWSSDPKRNTLPIIGYVSYFKLMNGFEKQLFMTVEELKGHANRYSQSYKRNAQSMNMWRDDFDLMCRKTMIKQIISKYGPMSTELERALVEDQSATTDGKRRYIDNEPVDAAEQAREKEEERIRQYIQKSTTLEDLQKCEDAVNESSSDQLIELFVSKKKELEGQRAKT